MAERIVLTGWSHITQVKDAKPPFLDPVDMMERAARDAATMAGEGIWPLLDTVLVVRSLSRNLRAPGEALVYRLGLKAHHVRVSGIGGETPQHFVNQAAGMLARGEAQAVLICGAETYYPRASGHVRGEGAIIQGIPEDYDPDDAIGSDALEQRHGLILPIHGFPLYETALWAKSGLNRDAWLARVGGLWSRFSEVAASHPNAWSRAPESASRIVTVAPDNRPICFPYTKRMVSLVMADLGAAVIMTTEARARRLMGGAAKPVYFLGGSFAKDRQRFMVAKSDFTRSPAVAAAADKAQRRAGLNIDDVEGFDLYSCFPSAVTIAMGELGLADNDPRPLTLTGGMGFFGGPGNNYALHGIASLAENIANGKLCNGMTTGLGWLIHKYAIGIYSASPTNRDLRADDQVDLQSPEVGLDPVPRSETTSGQGTIEAYTVIYARDQSPETGLMYGKTDAGLRFVANSPVDDVTFAKLTGENPIGMRVRLSHDATRRINIATLNY